MKLPAQDDGKVHLTYQALVDYERCPRLLALMRSTEPQRRRDEDGRPRFIGYLLQAVMADFYTKELWRRPTTVEIHLEAAVRHWAPLLTDAYGITWASSAEREKWEQVAIDAIPLILSTAAREGLLAQTALLERELTWEPVEGLVLHGRPDLLLVGEQVTLVDFKGGRVVGRYVQKDQLRLYALMVLHDPDIRTYPRRSGFWWLRHGQVQWLRSALKPEPFQTEVLATLVTIRADQELGLFEAKPAPSCGVCPVRASCPEGLLFLQEQRSRILVPDAIPSVNTGTFSL